VETLPTGVIGAGLLVSLSDRGFVDTFTEAGSLASETAEALRSAKALLEASALR
jgi:hypothetical protein